MIIIIAIIDYFCYHYWLFLWLLNIIIFVIIIVIIIIGHWWLDQEWANKIHDEGILSSVLDHQLTLDGANRFWPINIINTVHTAFLHASRTVHSAYWCARYACFFATSFAFWVKVCHFQCCAMVMKSCKDRDGEHQAEWCDGQYKVHFLCTKKDKTNSKYNTLWSLQKLIIMLWFTVVRQIKDARGAYKNMLKMCNNEQYPCTME